MRQKLDQRGPIDSLLTIGDVEHTRLRTALQRLRHFGRRDKKAFRQALRWNLRVILDGEF